MSSPCAYYEGGRCIELLTSHSWSVHKLALQVAERLLSLPRALGEIAGPQSLAKALEIAAVYHDLGKASASYQQARGSFALHEHVGAVVLWQAHELAERRGDESCSAMLLVAAGAVARHHVAMRGRHPAEVVRGKDGIRRIARAVRDMDPGVPRLLADGRVSQLIEGSIVILRRMDKLALRIRQILAILNNMDYYDKNLLIDTIQVAGALIVADILVSSVKRNNKITKNYAKSWAQELEITSKKIQETINYAKKPSINC